MALAGLIGGGVGIAAAGLAGALLVGGLLRGLGGLMPGDERTRQRRRLKWAKRIERRALGSAAADEAAPLRIGLGLERPTCNDVAREEEDPLVVELRRRASMAGVRWLRSAPRACFVPTWPVALAGLFALATAGFWTARAIDVGFWGAAPASQAVSDPSDSPGQSAVTAANGSGRSEQTGSAVQEARETVDGRFEDG
jgi:hypothetical protein